MIASLGILLFAAGAAPIAGGPLGLDNPEKEPSAKTTGKVYVWKSADGLAYEYYVPKGYDPDEGASMTVVLHGNGLDHRWTFWNHPAGEFRADDIVVSPDGTTAFENSNEFLGKKKDADQVHALLEELKSVWKVKQTFVYGHSQGSYFAFFYAGKYPEDVDGVCGHAGYWGPVTISRKGHHQAIGFLWGTEDGNVPYWQGWYGARDYRDGKYPLVHMKTLFDWPHMPHHFQAGNVLAWCEGMTSDDPDRVEICLEVLADPKHRDREGVDWSGLHAVAHRLAELEGASKSQQKRGRQLAAKVEKLAASHAEAITKALGRNKLNELASGTWSGHLNRFLEDFEGVLARDDFRSKHEKTLEKVYKAARDANEDYWKYKEKDVPKAFAAGLEMLELGYLDARCKGVLKRMEEWAEEAKDNKLSKKDVKTLGELSKAYAEGRKDGFKKYESLNRKAKL
ncbi:MAG: alpha/beta hydrolase-fold protein [Planctomycetota bacterium]|nr:alpha/beta hydrolase-fold protein [Planctomycetota bacterium]